MSLIELSEVYRWKIRPRLMGVAGVANVAAWGMRKRQLQVQVDPERLRAYGVTMDQALEETADALSVGLLAYKEGAKTGTGGFVETPEQRLQVRHVLPVATAGRPGARDPEGERRLDAAARRGCRRGRGPSADDWRRHRQRRSGPAAGRREVPLGQHARGHRRVSRRRSSR